MSGPHQLVEGLNRTKLEILELDGTLQQMVLRLVLQHQLSSLSLPCRF